MSDRYMSLKQISQRAAISDRTLRQYLPEIPHSRSGARGKIRIRWADFVAWMNYKKVQISRDDVVMDILKDMGASRGIQ